MAKNTLGPARAQPTRTGLRYPSDLSDTEWALIKPLLPVPSSRGRQAREGLARAAGALAEDVPGPARTAS